MVDTRFLFRSSILVITLYGLSRLTGFVKLLLMTRLFGVSAEADAFAAAYQLPELLVTMLAGGAVAAAFIPVYTAQLTSRDPQRAEQEAEGGITAVLTPAAEAESGFLFAGWRGEHCPSFNDPCILFMNTDRSALAVFAPPTSTLTITVTGEGQGLVRFDYENTAEQCEETCSVELPTRAASVLTAQPAPGMIFVGWGGDCFGVARTCALLMIGDQQVTAEFAVERRLYLPTVRR